MFPHIAENKWKAVVADTGVTEEFSITHDNQCSFRTGEGDIEPCLFLQKANAPLVTTSDGGVDDDVTLTSLKRIYCVDINFDVLKRNLLESVSDQFQLRAIRSN